MKNICSLALVCLFVQPTLAGKLVVCLKETPKWFSTGDGRLGHRGLGPALLVNKDKKQVTWVGTGGYIQVYGVQTHKGVMITRIDGRSGAEKILSIKESGRVTDYELADSLGGKGLLRVTMRDSVGKAVWDHSTDHSTETLDFCTSLVQEKY